MENDPQQLTDSQKRTKSPTFGEDLKKQQQLSSSQQSADQKTIPRAPGQLASNNNVNQFESASDRQNFQQQQQGGLTQSELRVSPERQKCRSAYNAALENVLNMGNEVDKVIDNYEVLQDELDMWKSRCEQIRNLANSLPVQGQLTEEQLQELKNQQPIFQSQQIYPNQQDRLPVGRQAESQYFEPTYQQQQQIQLLQTPNTSSQKQIAPQYNLSDQIKNVQILDNPEITQQSPSQQQQQQSQKSSQVQEFNQPSPSENAIEQQQQQFQSHQQPARSPTEQQFGISNQEPLAQYAPNSVKSSSVHQQPMNQSGSQSLQEPFTNQQQSVKSSQVVEPTMVNSQQIKSPTSESQQQQLQQLPQYQQQQQQLPQYQQQQQQKLPQYQQQQQINFVEKPKRAHRKPHNHNRDDNDEQNNSISQNSEQQQYQQENDTEKEEKEEEQVPLQSQVQEKQKQQFQQQQLPNLNNNILKLSMDLEKIQQLADQLKNRQVPHPDDVEEDDDEAAVVNQLTQSQPPNSVQFQPQKDNQYYQLYLIQQKEIELFKKKYVEVQQVLNQMMQNQNDLQLKQDKLNKDNMDLRITLAQKDKEIDMLKNQLGKYKSIQDLVGTISDQNEQLKNKLEKSVQNENKNNKELQSINQKMKDINQVLPMSQQSSQAPLTVADQLEKVAKYISENEELSKRNAGSERDLLEKIDYLQKQLDDTTEQLKEKELECNKTGKEFEIYKQLENERALEGQAEHDRKLIEDLQKQNAETIDNLKNQNQVLLKNNGELQNSCAGFQTQNAELQDQLNIKEQEEKIHQEKEKNFLQQRDEYERIIQNLNEQLEGQAAEIGKLQEQILELQNINKGLNKGMDINKLRIQELENQNSNQAEIIKAQQQQIENLLQSIEQKIKEIRDRDQIIESLNQALAQKQAEIEELLQIKAALEQDKIKNSKWKLKYAALKKEVTHLQKQFENYKISFLQEFQKNFTNESNNFENQIQGIKQRFQSQTVSEVSSQIDMIDQLQQQQMLQQLQQEQQQQQQTEERQSNPFRKSQQESLIAADQKSESSRSVASTQRQQLSPEQIEEKQQQQESEGLKNKLVSCEVPQFVQEQEKVQEQQQEQQQQAPESQRSNVANASQNVQPSVQGYIKTPQDGEITAQEQLIKMKNEQLDSQLRDLINMKAKYENSLSESKE